jgi:peroxiredoxin
MKTSRLIILFAVVALAAGLLTLPAQEENTPAPEFSLKDLRGNTVSLAGCRGKVLVLNFWATWCPPCRAEIPDLIETYGDMKGAGLEILGLSVDRITPDRLLEWVEKAGITYPVAVATQEIVEAYHPGDYIPSTIIIDKAGRIRYRNTGTIDRETLVRLIRKLAK